MPTTQKAGRKIWVWGNFVILSARVDSVSPFPSNEFPKSQARKSISFLNSDFSIPWILIPPAFSLCVDEVDLVGTNFTGGPDELAEIHCD